MGDCSVNFSPLINIIIVIVIKLCYLMCEAVNFQKLNCLFECFLDRIFAFKSSKDGTKKETPNT